MKKLLIAALVLLLLVAVGVIGVLPSLTRDNTVSATELNAVGSTATGATVTAASITTTKTAVPAEAVALTDWSALTDLAGTYKLTGNITATTTVAGTFTGKLYGDGFTVTASATLFENVSGATICDLTVNAAEGVTLADAAVAKTATGATLTNIVNNAPVNGTGNIGGIVATVSGDAATTISYCVNNAEVKTSLDLTVAPEVTVGAGGIVGRSTAKTLTLNYCLNAGAVTGVSVKTNANNGGVAGIVALAENVTAGAKLTVTNCVNSGAIRMGNGGDHNNGLSGVVGYTVVTENEIKNCRNTAEIGLVDGTQHVNAGVAGVVGQVGCNTTVATHYMVLDGCTNDGAIRNGRCGGVYGVNEQKVYLTFTNCINNGVITATANYGGGLASRIDPRAAATEAYPNPVTIRNCTNNGKVESTSAKDVSGFITWSDGTASVTLIENCTNAGEIVSKSSAGGFVSNSNCTFLVKNCLNAGNVTSAGNGGGIFGFLKNGTVENCLNTGTVNSSSQGGGIIAELTGAGIVVNCVNRGNVTTVKNDAAGIVGRMTGSTPTTQTYKGQTVGALYIESCQNYATITGSRNAGGISGWMSRPATYVSCANMGDVTAMGTGDGNGTHVGGITGRSSASATWTDCVNSAAVNYAGSSESTATSDYHGTGGIAGYVHTGSTTYTFTRCTNMGTVTAVQQVGGMIGYATDGVDVLTLIDCTNGGIVTATLPDNRSGVGGMVGMGHCKTQTYTNCLNIGTVDGNTVGNSNTGGMLGTIGNMDNSKTDGHFSVNATFTGCVNKGEIIGGRCGGIFGSNEHGKFTALNVTDCANYGTVNNYAYGGGLAGRIDPSGTVSFTRCVNYGTVYSYRDNMGGIVGVISSGGTGSNFTDCVNYGDLLPSAACLKDNKDLRIAGIAGGASGSGSTVATFTRCINYVDITSPGNAGGIAGAVSAIGKFYNCINYGNITGGTAVGGISSTVGSNNGHVFDGNIVVGNITGTGLKNTDKSHGVAGISGYTWGGTTVTNNAVLGNVHGCFDTEVTTGNMRVASGLVGYDNNDSYQFQYNYVAGTVTAEGRGCVAIMVKNAIGTSMATLYETRGFTKNYTFNSDLPLYHDKNGVSAVKASTLSRISLRNGALTAQLNADGGSFTQYVRCDGSSLPLPTATVATFAATCGDTHDFCVPSYDENAHWNQCRCGEIDNNSVVAHTLSYVAYEEGHVAACDCGYESAVVAHAPLHDTWFTNANEHYRVCEVCESEYARGAHVYGDTTAVDNTYHTAACACGQSDPRGMVPHTFDRYSYTDTEHWMECSCGVKKTDVFNLPAEAHDVDTSVWFTDGEFHWNECKCGFRANVEAHNGGTATCLNAAVCDVCNESYGSTGDVHEMAVRWDNITATNHTGIYTCCGLEIVTEAHIWGDDHICDACAYECLHEGGQADCTNYAICDICQKPYGDLIPDAHSGGTATCLAQKQCERCEAFYGELDPENHVSAETAYRVNAEDAEKHDLYHVCCGATIETTAHQELTAADCLNKAVCALCSAEYGEKDDTNHVDGCIIMWAPTDTPKDTHAGAYLYCGTIVEEAAHNFENSVCADCAYLCDVHEGGTATCIKLAECEHCGAEYGSLLDHEYDEETWTADDVNDVHYHACKTENCVARKDETACSGGTASCVELALCDICGQGHGALSAEHVWDTDNWTQDAENNTHYHKCTVEGCDARNEETACAGGADATCLTRSICATCNNAYGDLDDTNHEGQITGYTVNADDAEKHDAVYGDCCGAVIVESHVENTAADCVNKATCALCEAEYGTVSDVHDWDTTVWLQDAENNTHYHKCNVDGCDVRGDEQDCFGGQADCMNKAVCDVCNNVYGEVSVNHAWDDTQWYQDTENGTHYRKCTVNGCEERGFEDACASTTPATCCTPTTCDTCGNLFGESDPNAHTSQPVYEINTDDPNTHIEFYELCCGERFVVNHVVGTAATCQDAAVCLHCAQSYGEPDAEAHTWDTAWSFDADNKTHYHACTNGDCTARNEEAACDGGTVTCQSAAICAVCTNEYAPLDVNAHVEGTAATCVAPAICQLCTQSYGEPNTEAHAWDTVWSFDATTNEHYHACTNGDCTARNDVTACNGGEADCMNKAICEECYNAYGEVSVEHDWAQTLTDDGAGSHYYACTVVGCTAKDGEAAHDYTAAYGKDGDVHWGVCLCGAEDTANAVAHTYDVNVNTDDNDHWMECVCGQEQAGSRAAHDHQMTDATVEDGVHWTVCACGHETERVEHTYTILDKDAQQHWMVCVCGVIEQATVVDHAWVDGVCSNTDCGYTCLHNEDGFEYVIVPEGGHDKICFTCGVVVDHEEHDFSTGNYVSDSEQHWVSCICGQKQNEEGGVAHTIIGDATCTTLAVCQICGEFGDVDPENHASTDTVWEQIPGDLKQHAKLHACCQVLIEKVNHTYENGVCTGCEYVCTHTGGTLTCKDQATCTACGQAYGNTAEVAHTYDNACDNSCNVCGAERETAHTFGDWKTTKEATVTEKGSKERTCSVCGAKETQEIAVLVDPNAGKDDEAAAKKKQTTIIIVVAAVAAVVVIAAICIGVAVSKKRKAVDAVEVPTWIRKRRKKKKWKKR